MNRSVHAEASPHPQSCSSRRAARRPRLARLPVPAKRLTFDLDDPAERFIVEVIQRYFTDGSRGEKLLAMRRCETVVDGMRHRLVVQATRFRPKRPHVRTEWTLLIWDIDQPGVTFLKQPSRTARSDLFWRFNREK